MIEAAPEDDCEGDCPMPEQQVAGIVVLTSGLVLTGTGVTVIVYGAIPETASPARPPSPTRTAGSRLLGVAYRF